MNKRIYRGDIFRISDSDFDFTWKAKQTFAIRQYTLIYETDFYLTFIDKYINTDIIYE